MTKYTLGLKLGNDVKFILDIYADNKNEACCQQPLP